MTFVIGIIALYSATIFIIFSFSVAQAYAATENITEYSSINSQEIIVTIEDRFNNQNWFTRSHPQPASFTVTKEGESYGTTTTGIGFTQVNIPNKFGVRVEKFTIQDHYHYIVNGDVVYTPEALSQRLTELQEV